jgi:hypothetical protein
MTTNLCACYSHTAIERLKTVITLTRQRHDITHELHPIPPVMPSARQATLEVIR